MKNRKFCLLLVLLLPFMHSCEKGDVEKNEPYDKNVTAIAVHNNIIWVGTNKNGLYKFDGDQWTSYTSKDGLLTDTISSLAVSADGCLWIGTNKGLSKFENETWTDFTTDDGLYNNIIYSLTCDQQDNIWIGTRSNRVVKYDGADFTTYHVNPDVSGQMGHIHSITCDLVGNVWLGSCISGLSKFDGASWTDGIENLNVFVNSSMCTADGDVWIGHYTGAFLLSGGVWTKYSTENGLIDDNVQCFTVDKQDNIWIGTAAGLSKFDGTSWTGYTTDNDLPDNFISALACDINGDIWVGSTVGGLAKLTNTK